MFEHYGLSRPVERPPGRASGPRAGLRLGAAAVLITSALLQLVEPERGLAPLTAAAVIALIVLAVAMQRSSLARRLARAPSRAAVSQIAFLAAVLVVAELLTHPYYRLQPEGQMALGGALMLLVGLW